MNAPIELFPRIMSAIDLISQGRTKTSACDASGISITAFDTHIGSNEALQNLAAEAVRRGEDALADILLEINTHLYYGTMDPRMASVLSKNIQWYLARKRPKDYGDKMLIEHSISADKIIVDALTRGRNRAITGNVLDGVEYVVVDDDEEAKLRALY